MSAIVRQGRVRWLVIVCIDGNASLAISLLVSCRTCGQGCKLASKAQMTGMLGVYMVAAELSRLGFIVSPTSRSARGADLLVTNQTCTRTISVQVKTNASTF